MNGTRINHFKHVVLSTVSDATTNLSALHLALLA